MCVKMEEEIKKNIIFFSKPIAKNEKMWYYNAVCKDKPCNEDTCIYFYGGTYK